MKDRLYCENVNSPYRAGAVDVIGAILAVVVRSIAPIVPHLAEEVWLYHPENLGIVISFQKKNLFSKYKLSIFNVQLKFYSFRTIVSFWL